MDALALACEGSCDAHVSPGEKCEGVLHDSNRQVEISHTCHEVASTNIDRLHITQTQI